MENIMDSNDSMKLMVQFLAGILVLVSILAVYMKYKSPEVIEGNEDRIELVN
jgi:hypothetical protein